MILFRFPLFFHIVFIFSSLLPSVKNSKADTVGANVNKAQEDLAKARKLIKSMRSLEKNASKPSQSSTVDDEPRLHQVASSKRSLDKEGSQRYFKTGMQSLKCAVPENIHTPLTEGIGIPWGVGGSVRPKNLKKFMKLNIIGISRGVGGGA